MIYPVTITSQGQISIPIKLRRELGLDKTKRAFVSSREGKIVIEPVKDLLELRGSIKTDKKPLSNRKLHEFVARVVADEYVKKIRRIK